MDKRDRPTCWKTQVWDGTAVLLKLLHSAEAARLAGQRVLELGSGTGLAGLVAAHLGAHVLLTDVRSVTSLLQRNVAANAPASPAAAPPASSGSACPDTAAASSRCWKGATSVGAGSAAVAALDWTGSVSDQLGNAAQDFEQLGLVIACEVLWLEELVQPFVQTLAQLLKQANRNHHGAAKCLMSYTHRGHAESKTFTCKQRVLACMQAHGCDVREVTDMASLTSDGERIEAWVVSACKQVHCEPR